MIDFLTGNMKEYHGPLGWHIFVSYTPFFIFLFLWNGGFQTLLSE